MKEGNERREEEREGGRGREKERKGKFLTFAGISVSKLTPGLSEVVSNCSIIHNL